VHVIRARDPRLREYRLSNKSRPITIEVGFLLESTFYNNKISESNDKVEFL
jgi:hypothetical protein